MSAPHDDYKPLDIPAGQRLAECPVCGSDASLWKFSESEKAEASKTVMCNHGEAFGPQLGFVNEGCLLYMPPHEFYKPTIREAIKFWNDYSSSLLKLQRHNRWQRANVLRDNQPGQ